MSYAADATEMYQERARRAALLQERFWADVRSQTGWTPPRARTGYTTPSELMRQIDDIDSSSSSLDRDIHLNVVDPNFKNAWGAWLVQFRAYKDKWLGLMMRIPMATTQNSEVEASNRKYQADLENWYAKYKQQTSASGQPVPPPSGIDPIAPPPPPNKPSGGKSGDGGVGFEMPWYAWMLGGIALVGIGYLGVRWYQRTTARADEATRMLLQSKGIGLDQSRDFGHVVLTAAPVAAPALIST